MRRVHVFQLRVWVCVREGEAPTPFYTELDGTIIPKQIRSVQALEAKIHFCGIKIPVEQMIILTPDEVTADLLIDHILMR